MKFVVVVAVLLAFAAVAVSAEDEKVVTLTTKNFDEFLAKTPLSLIEFYAPWCGHCKALAPEYETAAKQLEGQNGGVLAKVDCTTERELCTKYDVQGFPTVKLFRNDGSDPVDYDQARKADAIVKYMIKQNAPAVTELADVDAVKNFAKDEAVKVVIFHGASDNIEAYTKVASALRNEYFFGSVKDNAAANAEFKVTSTPAVVLFRNFDEGNLVYSGDLAEVDKYIKANSFPLVGTIGPENYAKYLERGYNFVWIFIDLENEEHKKLITEAVTPVAAEFRDKLSFVQLDGIKWVEHAKSFGLSGNTPGIVIEDRDKRKNFVFPESTAVTKDSFRAHVDGVLKGTVAATVKSEPEPADNSGPVKVIVGTTFDKIVMDDSKDVLVEFYAPWCGHCKALTPKYEELGKMFADDSTVVVAKLDSTANDSPADVQGFPTIILYPAGDKSNPVNYEGARTAKAMAAFIKANGKANGRPIKDAEADAGADGESDDESDEENNTNFNEEEEDEHHHAGGGGDDDQMMDDAGGEHAGFDFDGEGAEFSDEQLGEADFEHMDGEDVMGDHGDLDFGGEGGDDEATMAEAPEHEGHDHGDHDGHDHGHDEEL